MTSHLNDIIFIEVKESFWSEKMEEKLLFHITSYRNLHSILQKGEILAHSKVITNKLVFDDIAHGNIQERRAN